jgi:ribosomal protein S18 acetylase RimI-like enzyme
MAHIRPYRDADLRAVYDVCVRTADAGGDARGKYRSDDLMPDLFAGPYVFLEPDFAFVLDDGLGDEGQGAVGYVLGTPDTAAFVRAYRERWIPRLAGRYSAPPDNPAPPDSAVPSGNPASPAPPARPDDEMIALHYRPERLLWPGLDAYPAHLHIDLLPPFQGAGHGRALMETFYAAAARAGAPGVHLTVLAANTRAIGFYRHLGLRRLDPAEPGEARVVYLGREL